jgi:MFS family permease
VWQLILTQGVFYGIGSGFLYLTALSYVNEWFVRRRGLAYGVIFGGAGASGLLLPLLFEGLLTAYDYRVALRTWAVIMVNVFE